MERTVDWIMQYVENAYLLDSDQKEVLRFGIQSAMELLINFWVSIFILCKIGMVWEGVLFFLIFIPIRTLAGGYHSDTYLRYLIFSIITLITVLEMSIYLKIPAGLALGIIVSVEMVIGRIAPVVNDRRPVSKREYLAFSRKLKVILILDAVLSLYCWRRSFVRAINIIMLSMVLILVTLITGKVKYKTNQIAM